MADLRVGIIGAGQLASSRIYPCLHYLPVQLAAVCDLDRTRAERNARKFGGQAVFTDYRAMLAEAHLDAVIVCVGPEAHHTLAIDIMEAGIPVYTEKPPAVTAAHAHAVLETSRKQKILCMTGFKKRFAPAYQKAKAALLDPNFGEPTLLSINYCCGSTYSNDPENPRSKFLLDFCIHIIDLSCYLFGPVADVYARKCGPSTYAVNLLFRSGAVGVLGMTAHRDWNVSTEQVELTGSPGQFISLRNSVEMVRFSGDSIVDWHKPTFSTARGDSLIETGFARELEEFVAAIRDARSPESSIASAYETMRVYEAIEQAASSNQSITLDEVGTRVTP